MPNLVYADYNATTPICEASKAKILKALEVWGNPSSSHCLGRQATALMEEARACVAQHAGAEPNEVVFTSGGSEADNLALIGSSYLHRDGFRLITSGMEHSAVRDTLDFLIDSGAQVELVPSLPSGALDKGAYQRLLKEFQPHLVSLMAANNETGVIYPVNELALMAHDAGAVFHTDAVQGFGKLHPDHWKEADLIAISGHKIQGPKGVGALIVRSGRQLVATHYGGSQEVKRRGGTQNVLGICGFGGACESLDLNAWNRVRELRDAWETKIQEAIPDMTIQGAELDRVANTSNLRFPKIPSEVLLGALDMEGICVSAGSACSSGSLSASPVLLAMGMEPQAARECLRFSFGPDTTEEDFDTIAQSVINHVTRIRNRRQRSR